MIGHNTPPEPFDGFKLHIDELLEQAEQFLDGEGINDDAQAEDVSRLLNMIRKASNDADEARKTEKKPHDDAAKAVQTKWKPLLDAADLAATTCKRALEPFLLRKQEEQRAAAEALRREAEQKAAAAAKLEREMAPESLTAQRYLKAAKEEAASIAKEADRAEKAKAHATGGERAIGLRTSYRAEITDPIEFGKWLWEHRRPDYLEWLEEFAKRESRHGDRGIPGVKVHEDRKAA